MQYDIPPLVEACIESMLTNIGVDSAAKVFYFADLHQLDGLKEQTLQFIAEYPKEVRKSDGWAQYIKPNVELFEQIFDYFESLLSQALESVSIETLISKVASSEGKTMEKKPQSESNSEEEDDDMGFGLF